ncbi:MAG: FkbM family methyltransferase [Pseudomonadota bacterium]
MSIIKLDSVFGPILVRQNDLIEQHIRNYGAHTRTDLAFLLSLVKPGDQLFDLGAHIGTFAVPLLKKTGPGGRLLAVEGNPETYELLVRNLGQSGLSNSCTALNDVVAPDSRRFRMINHPSNTGACYFEAADEGDPGTRRGIPLAELCRSYFVPRLIKLDIEGLEFAVLSSAPLIEFGNPILFVEVSRDWPDRDAGSFGDLERLLREQGYRFFWNKEPGHATNDIFTVDRLDTFGEVLQTKLQFNVLAVHEEDERMDELLVPPSSA